MASPQLGADPPALAPGPPRPVMATAGGQGREDPAWPDGRDGWSWAMCQRPPPHFCLGPAEGLGSRPGEKQEFSLEGLGARELGYWGWGPVQTAHAPGGCSLTHHTPSHRGAGQPETGHGKGNFAENVLKGGLIKVTPLGPGGARPSGWAVDSPPP